jgi:hypothetical protein
MMAQPDSSSNNTNNPSAALLQQSRTSHNERTALLDIKYNVGQFIQYTDHAGKIQYVVKNAPGEFMDLRTMQPVPLGSVVGELLKGAVVSRTQIQNVIQNDPTILLKDFKKRNLIIDFETAFVKDVKKMELSDIYSVSAGGRSAHDIGRYTGADYYVTDIFHEMMGDNAEQSRHAFNKFGMMSENIKAGYFKRFSKLKGSAGLSPIELADINEAKTMADMITKQGAFTKILKHIENTKAPIELSAGDIGLPIANNEEYKLAIGRGEYAQDFVHGALGVKDRVTFGSFNPAGIDKWASDVIGKYSKNPASVDMIDLRGYELFRNSLLFPNLTQNMTATLGPAMNDIAHRLRLSDKQTKAFLEMGEKGIGSFSRKATTAEAFHETMRYATHGNTNSGFQAQSHESLNDIREHGKVLEMGDNLTKLATQERINPSLQYHSPRSRILIGTMRYMQAVASAEASELAGVVPKSQLIKQGLMRFDQGINYNNLEKIVSTNIESTMAIRTEKGFLQSNVKQFGGGTISQLLGGSFLVAGIHASVRKIKERFTETRENNMEGLSHNSIMTNMQRLINTDFGSGLQGMFDVAKGSAKILTQIFRNQIKNPSGSGRIIKNHLSGINKTIQEGRKAHGTFLEMLKNPERMQDLTTKIFGPEDGHIVRLIDELHDKEKISRVTRDTLEKANTKIRDVFFDYSEMIGQKSADKTLGNTIKDAFSSMVASRGKDGKFKLKPTGWALGAGAFGALGLMLTRGSYDPELAAVPIQNPYTQDKLRYAERTRPKRQQFVQDMQNAQREGIGLQSQQRQQQRYSKTDFGSPISQGLDVTMRVAKRIATNASRVTGKIEQTFEDIATRISSKDTSIASNPTRAFTDMPTKINPKEYSTGPRLSEKQSRNKALQFKNKLEGKKGAIQEFISKPENISSAKATRNKKQLKAFNYKQYPHYLKRYGNAITLDGPEINPNLLTGARTQVRSRGKLTSEKVAPPIKSHAKKVSRNISKSSTKNSSNMEVKVPISNRDISTVPNAEAKARHFVDTESRKPNINKVDIHDVNKGMRDPTTGKVQLPDNAENIIDNASRQAARNNPAAHRIHGETENRYGHIADSHSVKRHTPSDAKMLQMQYGRPTDRAYLKGGKYTSTRAINSESLDPRPTIIKQSGISKTPDDYPIVHKGRYTEEDAFAFKQTSLRSNIDSLHTINDGITIQMTRPPRWSGNKVNYGSSKMPYIPLVGVDPRLTLPL